MLTIKELNNCIKQITKATEIEELKVIETYISSLRLVRGDSYSLLYKSNKLFKKLKKQHKVKVTLLENNFKNIPIVYEQDLSDKYRPKVLCVSKDTFSSLSKDNIEEHKKGLLKILKSLIEIRRRFPSMPLPFDHPHKQSEFWFKNLEIKEYVEHNKNQLFNGR